MWLKPHSQGRRGDLVLLRLRKLNGLEEPRPQFSDLSTQGSVFLDEFPTFRLAAMFGLDGVLHRLAIAVNALPAATSKPGSLSHGATEASKTCSGVGDPANDGYGAHGGMAPRV